MYPLVPAFYMMRQILNHWGLALKQASTFLKQVKHMFSKHTLCGLSPSGKEEVIVPAICLSLNSHSPGCFFKAFDVFVQRKICCCSYCQFLIIILRRSGKNIERGKNSWVSFNGKTSLSSLRNGFVLNWHLQYKSGPQPPYFFSLTSTCFNMLSAVTIPEEVRLSCPCIAVILQTSKRKKNGTDTNL